MDPAWSTVRVPGQAPKLQRSPVRQTGYDPYPGSHASSSQGPTVHQGAGRRVWGVGRSRSAGVEGILSMALAVWGSFLLFLRRGPHARMLDQFLLKGHKL